MTSLNTALFFIRWMIGWTATLWILDVASVPWTAGSSALAAAVGLTVAAVAARRPATEESSPDSNKADTGFRHLGLFFCWGAFLLLATATFLGWNVMSDYVFHWGVKGKRFALEGGIDFQFLSRYWNFYLHPDYPNLIPSLYASLMLLVGSQSWYASAPVSIVGFAVLILALRHLVHQVIPSPMERAATLGLVLSGFAAFAMRPMIAGGGELMVCSALVLGVSALYRPRSENAPKLVCWASALAAWSKMEGMVLAALLLTIFTLTHLAQGRDLKATIWIALKTSWVTLVGVAYWLYGVLRFDLFLESNSAGLSFEHARTVVDGLLVALSAPHWHGMPWLLVLLPILWIDRRFRLPALLIGLQLSFYVYAYLAGPVDPSFWIQTSASRLYFHLLPATTVLLVGWWCRRTDSNLPPAGADLNR